jgi:hypothetical protein
MSTDSRVSESRLDIASLRILRLAFGTAASLWFSQATGWTLSFIAPVMTMFMLALPLPVPKLKNGILFVLALVASLLAGTLLLPRILNQPLVGLLLLVLALYWSFYFTAKGGSAVVGTFLTIGIAMATAVGTVSVDGLLAVIQGLALGAVAGIAFVWVAHAILPDSLALGGPAPPPPKPATSSPELFAARWNAFRSLVIVLPIALWFLFSSASASYVPVMIKVASMGQQASNDDTKVAGRSLIMSTIIGGIGAVVGWQMLRIVPELSVYTLIIGLAGLIAGPRIFRGKGMAPDGGTWSYAYLTMIVILAPAVMDGVGGDAAGAKFLDRIIMFALTTLYAVAAVYVFDAFRPRRGPAPGD